jgi:seryl-tRNA synthetase
MSDAKVEAFKKSAAKAADAWGKELEKISKRIDELFKLRDEIEKQTTDSIGVLQKDLLKVKVPAGADEKELAKVPAWFQDLMTKKLGVIGKGLEAYGEARFDDNPKVLLIGLVVAAWKKL